MKLASIFLVALTLAACGRKDDEQDPQSKTGRYALGDYTKVKVEREGFGSLKTFFTEAEVKAIDGAVATIEYRDLRDGDLSLIDWNDGANPETVTVDYNSPTTAATATRECSYAVEQGMSLTVPAGAYDCVSFSYTCKEGADTIRYSGCQSALVAISQLVSTKKEWLDPAHPEAAPLKWYQKTLLENRKN